jgi:diguanylate cyclase (GGDEF)-like protein
MPLIINGMILFIILALTFAAVILFKQLSQSFNLQLVFGIIVASTFVLVAASFLIRSTFKTFQQQTTAELAIDQLTGFMSRHVFGQVFNQVISDMKRSRQAVSVILVDIDRFRLINEKYNNKTGDLLLTKLGTTIKETLRESDMTCRWDGDEFLVLLRDCGATNAGNVAQKVLQAIRELHVGPKDRPVDFSVSIGVAQMTSKDSMETLVDRAQTGLYSARDNGRNCCAVGYDWILIDYYFKPIF